MIRGIFIAFAVGLVVTGCDGKPDTVPSSAGSSTSVTGTDAGADTAPADSAGQIKALLFRRGSADGEFIGPSLEVFSPNASEVEPGVMNFGDARVTIFAEDDKQTVMTAKNGVLDQNEETAELSGEVVVTMGSQTLTMEQLSWNNEKREAVSRTEVKIIDGDTVLSADAMRFSPDENTLTLEKVTGVIQLPDTGSSSEARRRPSTWRTLAMWLVMATPAYAQVGDDTAYTHVVIEKPAPEVVFRDNRLDQMTGGVEIDLKTADENQPPLTLGADTITFGWKEGDSTELAALEMKGNVSVTNSEGEMRAADAQFDVAKMVIAFTGGVSGSFEGIEKFEADRLTYQIESGDMKMQNLKATIPFAEAQNDGSDGFSQMVVERAATVRIADGKVQDMRGGVDLSLTPTGSGAKPIALQADTFDFTYADAEQRQPGSVAMKGAVRVDAPQGLIRSDRADFNVSSGALEFRGNVRGQSDVLKSFHATSFDYDLDTEDGFLQSFRADGVQMGNDGGGYDRMDVRRAPKVRMTGGRVTTMSGGVEISLAGDAERGPLTANAETVQIAYDSPNATGPSAVNMKGEVHVVSGETDIHSDTADLDMAAETLVFIGNFRADLERAKGVTGSRARYDLKTGNFKLLKGHVPEIARTETDESSDTL